MPIDPRICGKPGNRGIPQVKTDTVRESSMLKVNSIVAVYDRQAEVEAAVRDLQSSGFDLKKLSVLGREHESGERLTGHYLARGGRMRYLGPRGAFWNELWDILAGAA